MIIDELKSFLRATILMSTDMTKKEFSLELLEKIIAMEQKLQASKDIYIEPPAPELPKGWINPLTGQTIPEPPKMMTATDVLIREKNLFPGATIDRPGIIQTNAP